MRLLVLLAACRPTTSTSPTDGPPSDTSAPAGDTAWTTASTGTPPTSVEAEVTLAPGGACADPSIRAGGTAFVVETMPYVERQPWLDFDGGGVGVGDFDRNGTLDVLVLGHEREEYLDQRSPGRFVPVESGYKDPSVDLSNGFGAAVADYDADGDLDVFVSRYLAPDVLLENDGSGYFTDAALEAGVADDASHRTASATFSDWDGDGDLDLYVAGHGGPFSLGDPEPPPDPDRLYENRGDGTFADRSDLLPAYLHRGRAFVPLFLDLDGDGWRDLFLAVDKYGDAEVPCLLAWNREGTFVLDGGAAGLDRPVSAMGIGVGDVDEDGSWDLLLTAWGYSELLLSSPYGVWVDHADATGLVHDLADLQVVGWGTELADLDDDTRLDVIMGFGQLLPEYTESPVGEPNGAWRQTEDGRFEDVRTLWGFEDRGITRGIGVADLDADGWLDVVVPRLDGPTLLYRAACGEAAWLEVALAQPGTSNPDAVGATVEVSFGGRTLRRPVLAGGTSLGVGLPPLVHFGLAAAEEVELSVVWPDGERSALGAVPTRHRVTVTRSR